MLARLNGQQALLSQWPLDQVKRVGVATGLTALSARLGVFDDAQPEVTEYLAEQQLQVSQRVQQFIALTPVVTHALHDAGIPVRAVKGAALLTGTWGLPETRPMADIDLIVDPRQRAQASAALTQAGLRPLSSSAFEDTLLAWGDGSVGRVDGESAAHNGRVEIHPGWIEFLHGYTVSGCDLLSTPFDREAMVSHVIGHLASTVIRAEVRAVNVVDMWWCAQQTLDWERIEALLIRCDTRLSAPGLWITQQLLGDAIPEQMVTRQMNRLPRRGRGLLQHATPPDVLRDPTQRTSLRWRQSFASTGRERTSVLGQMIWPQGPHTFAAAVYRVRHR